MQGSQQFCYKHPGGEDIYLFRLMNSQQTEVLISNYGATITSFKINSPASGSNDIVLGFDSMQEYTAPAYLREYPWFGAAVGRYGNRIKNAEFEVDGRHYTLSKNNANDQLHGGIEGFDKKIWHVISSSENTLEMVHMSPAGDEGYPGNLEVTIRFELNDQNELSHEYTAITDQATPVNLTHHGYFNLNNGEGLINDHILMIPASRTLEQDGNLVVTGNYKPVEGTSFDFRKPKKISADWDPAVGYDQSFVVDNKTAELSLVAEVISPKSKTTLQVLSTQPVVHFYSGLWIPRVTGKNGIAYQPFSGFCLETQVHPNAINIPEFPDTVLRPGQTYHSKTVYRVSMNY